MSEVFTECFEGFPPPGDPAKKLVRRTDPPTAKRAAEDTAAREGCVLTPGSHRARILEAYSNGQHMTDWEAAELCDLKRPGVCYWHRAGDLLAVGYLEDTGETRVNPDTGKARRVMVITASGIAALARLRCE